MLSMNNYGSMKELAHYSLHSLLEGKCPGVNSVSCTCVLLYPGKGLLKCICSSRALGGVRWQAVGIHGFNCWVAVGLVRDASETVDNWRDDAGHS